MAHATDVARQDSDKLLDELAYQWGRVPPVAAEIDAWEWVDQLSAEQRDRYAALVRLIVQNRPVLRRLQHS